jgi:Coenzyme PQQ synthesis protein D (PqqD)
VIWLQLEQPQTFAQLCEALGRRYAGAADVIAADTRRFVEKMAAETLVTLT